MDNPSRARGRGDPALAERIKHLPTWIFHGKKDTVVPFMHSKAMYDALKQYGNTEFTVYPEADHDSWTESYENKRLYDWFLSHRRGEYRKIRVVITSHILF